jgi:signal transduction histidine kinase
MLREFLTENREELIERCRFKVTMRRAPRATPRELSHGVPLFLDQLIEVFPKAGKLENGKDLADGPATAHEIAQTAARHGKELLQHDFTIEQVVHDYGDLCQSITELAVDRAASITVQEFGSLNITLDNAIASAVTSFSAGPEAALGAGSKLAATQRLGLLANTMRNLLNTAILAASAMKRGSVGLGGATAAALDRSLIAMRSLIDSTLAEVRLESNEVDAAEVIEVGPFIAEIQLAASLEAAAVTCELTVMVQPDIFVQGDRHLLSSAVANVLHAAVTTTKRGGEVFLTARSIEGRVVIDVEDACAGLEPEVVQNIIARFDDRIGSGSSLGCTLDAARKAVEANSGTLTARAVVGKGCIYVIDLPQAR